MSKGFHMFIPLQGNPPEEAMATIELLISATVRNMGATWCDTMSCRNKAGIWGINAQGGIPADHDAKVYRKWVDRLMGVVKYGTEAPNNL